MLNRKINPKRHIWKKTKTNPQGLNLKKWRAGNRALVKKDYDYYTKLKIGNKLWVDGRNPKAQAARNAGSFNAYYRYGNTGSYKARKYKKHKKS